MASRGRCGFEFGEPIEHSGVANTTYGTVQQSYVRTGDYAWRVGNTGDAYVGWTLTNEPDEVYLRAAVMFRDLTDAYADGTADYQAFMDVWGHGASHLSVAVDVNLNRLVLLHGATGALGWSGGAVLDRGDAVFSFGRWYVVELYAKIHATTGTAVVKVNNVTDLNYTGDTDAAGSAIISRVRFGNSRSATINYHYIYLDDIGINDTTGSYQNSWVGQGGVRLLKPNADGAQTDWAPSSGTVHYTMVDDVPDDADTTYISSQTVGHIDLFDIEDLDSTIDAIDLVEPCWQAALATAGFEHIRPVLRHGTANYPGSTASITDVAPSYQLYKGTAWYLNPAGSAWSTADVNALQVGVEVI